MTLKRTLDLALSTVGLAAAAPLFAGAAIAIRLDDGGPVFFRHERVGRGGRPFSMLKLRSMRENAGGMPLTVAGDSRITRTGHWLRKFKLDELPQLINVLRGEMSLVGPRPEVPKYVLHYRPEDRAVLDLIPGITDPASIRFRDESAMLTAESDPERIYIEKILPEKIRMNLDYAARANAWTDLGVLVRTVGRLLADRVGT